MKKGIRTKILAVSLSVCMASIFLSAGISLFSSFFLTRRALWGNGEISSLASENSERLLIEQAVENATELAVAKAENINRQISGFVTMLNGIRDYTACLYKEKDGIALKTVPPVDEIAAAGNTSGITLHMSLCPGTEYESVHEELGFYGNIEPALRSAMNNRRQITSIYIATESGLNIGFDANAADKSAGGDYDGRDTEWYRHARTETEPYISEAYSDTFGRGLTITIAVALDGCASPAVFGMDILIEDLNRDVLQTGIGENGYAMLIGKDANMISAPGLSVQGESALSYLGTAGDYILDDMRSGVHGAQTSQIEGKDVSVVYAPAGIAGWSLAVVIPLEDVVAPAVQAKTIIGDITVRTEAEMKRQTTGTAISLAALFSVMTALAALLIFKLSRRIINPLLHLCGEVKNIGQGNLDYICDISTGDELEELGHAFEVMTGELKGYIGNLAAITAEKERIATELNVAARIQTGMLPSTSPAFNRRMDFEIHASMRAAKEVGGDFYDFFLLDNNRLAVIIADVSGKGVPAALFMVIAKTLVRNFCQIGLEPAAALEVVNDQLCENNPEGLFVTAFLGILEIDSGRFVYANAGHNPPLVCSRGRWEWLQTDPGFVLAGMDGINFNQQETILYVEDSLLLYTDGVTEAQNPSGALYSEKRLIELLNRKGDDCDVRQIIGDVNADIDRFADGAPQADDITMLALEIK